MLERFDPSPLHSLERAVAVAEARGPAAGLALLDVLVPPAWLEGHYLWAAVLADLHRGPGNAQVAREYAEQAFAGAPSRALEQLLRRWGAR